MKRNIIFILLIIILTYFFQSWILSPMNFFFLDDWDHLFKAQFISYTDLWHLFPVQMYNDRPLGFIFVKLIYQIYGLNSSAFHIIFLSLHILNSILVYFFFKRSLNSNIQSFLIALIFANWPKSIMAAQWTAAVFDTLSCFLGLIYLNLSFFKNKFIKIFSLVIFFLALRTKESVIFLPLIPIIFNFLKTKKISLTLDFFISIFYSLYLFYLSKISQNQGYDQGNPYYPNYNPLNWLINLFKYLYIYFGITETTFAFSGFRLLGLICLFASLLAIFTLLVFYFRKHANLSLPAFSFFCFLVTMIPILPLVNRQQKLYLYLPSMFISGLIIILLTNFFKIKYIFTSTLMFLLILNKFNHWQNLDTSFWLHYNQENRTAFSNLKNIPECSSYYIYNIDNLNTNVFNYGPGFATKIFFNRPELNIILSESVTPQPNLPNSCQINYNKGSLNFLNTNKYEIL